MWRFIPIFDPYVDYLLSRDLDSPVIQHEIQTINMWLSKKPKKEFFPRLWGAALKYARKKLFHIFEPMLLSSIAAYYQNVGDQHCLADIVWNSVKDTAFIFDSYSCRTFRMSTKETS
jgi:hypothetical protein